MSVHTDPETSPAQASTGGGNADELTPPSTRPPTPGLGLRLAGLTGAGSLVAAFFGLSISETDTLGLDPHSSAGVLVDAYGGHTAELRTGAILCTLAAVLALVFAGPLWMRLKSSGEWQAMVAVAGAVTMGLAWMAVALEQVAFMTFVEYSNGEAARMLLVTTWGNWGYLTFPFLIIAIAGALASLPTWFRCLSVVVAVIEAYAVLPQSDPWLPAMIGFAYGITVSLFVVLSPGTRAAAR